ncbi:Ubiquitin--protein ligase [Bertholletia excelsa]
MEITDFPQHFRCPISMELMEDPVTISTGVTYDRKNIETWFLTYKKTTCPATMQPISDFQLTPNLTLKRLILSWLAKNFPRPPPPDTPKHGEMISLLTTLETTPFKENSLKKLKSMVEMGGEVKDDFVRSGGVEAILRILVVESSDFAAFTACEEALGVLHKLLAFPGEEKTMKLLSDPEPTRALVVMLQRGSAEARHYAVSILQKLAKATDNPNWISFLVQDHQGIDFFKSMLELISDQIYTKASSCALHVLIEVLSSSKTSRLKAIEAGAVCLLIELLPESNKSRSEKIMQVIKLICQCAEGRAAFTEHRLGIAAVAKKMVSVSNVASRVGVRIMWLICNSHPTERVLKEMVAAGAVEKMAALLHVDGGRSSSMKGQVVKMLRMHEGSWRRHPCFEGVLEYLGLGNGSF